MNEVIEERGVCGRAKATIKAHLAALGVHAGLRLVREEVGWKLNVIVRAADVDDVLDWRHGFGRSYGPIRINIVEGDPS